MLRCVFGNVWLHFLLMSWIYKLFLVRNYFGFCVGQTDSKYPQNSDSDFNLPCASHSKT